MAKKLTLLAMAVGALVAFAIPAMASAEITKGGVPVGVKEVITGTSTNAKTVTSLGTLTCEKVTINAELTENEGESVAAVGSGEGTTSVCKLGTTSITVKNIKVNSLDQTGPGAGLANFSFEAVLPGLTCKYVSSGTGTAVSWTPPSGSIHVAGSLTASPSACGTATFSGDFALEQGASALVID